MNSISCFNSCVNCGACINTCPMDAISVDKDNLFFELAVDEDKCIHCGKCIKVCPENAFKPHLSLREAYGGWSKDIDIVQSSSSGGAFSVIANYILKNNGIVYGAAFSDDRKQVVFRSTKEVSLDELRRSKYVESQTQYTFRQIKSDLEAGIKVLFCGSPCQVAGLKRYLNDDYENLLTCDFACGGMASHKIYEDYLVKLEKKYNSKIIDVNFRPKLYGWSLHAIKIDFLNGKAYKMIGEYDPYMYSFVYGRTSIRENCLDCKFRENHYGDIIIADFWKWDTISDLENNEKGISLIITNSQKGEEIINAIKPQMVIKKLDLQNASYNCNPILPISKETVAKREAFLRTYQKAGLKQAAVGAGMKHGIEAMVLKTYKIFKRRIIKNEK